MEPRAAYVLALLLLGGVLSGCLSEEGTPGATLAAQQGPRARPTVVALIDSGITPYHEAFRAKAGGIRVDDYRDLVPGAELTSPSRDGAYEAGKLYAFAGTRVLAIGLKNTSGALPVMDETDHGTGTASMVAREDPNALIVMVQAESDGCPSPPQDCPLFPPLAEGMEWAARQPWIDIISVSMGPPGNAPTKAAGTEGLRFLAASKLAHDQGKLVVAAAGNQPIPSLGQYFAGPPWIIAVGGFLPNSRGETVVSSKGVDVVANSTDIVATASTENETHTNGGTSFAAPIVAGTLSRALYELRAELQHHEGIMADGALAIGVDASGAPVRLTSKDLWDALNATASYVAPTDWDPTKASANGTRGLLDQSIPILAPPLQMGWGYVHGGLAPDLVEWALAPDHKLPESKVTAAQFQAQRQAAREEYWRNLSGP